MMCLPLLLLVGSSLALQNNLEDILKSPKATLKLYQDFKAAEHLNFARGEDRMRFGLFRKNAQFVAAANSNIQDRARYGINFFSTMTEEEKSGYLGYNSTGREPNPPAPLSSSISAPAEKLWVKEGAVTPVKNQGDCGSCWTFGAVGGLETRYKELSGVLRDFSEQEYLDCSYEYNSLRHGCRGGYPDDCYIYSYEYGGRLASTSDYPYRAVDGKCHFGAVPDSMISHKITDVVYVPRGEAANIEALSTGSLSVAFEVTNFFFQYESGIIKDTTCKPRPNHAVSAVGYTPEYVLVKNSWGKGWGDKGFVKFTRNYHNCGLFDHSTYPVLTATGVADTSLSDKATNYDPEGGEQPTEDDGERPTYDPDCKDKATNCARDNICEGDQDFARNWCRRHCGFCSDGCPEGTVRCDDGICKHVHMC